MKEPRVKFNLPDQWKLESKVIDQPFKYEGCDDDFEEVYEIEEYEILPLGDESLVNIHIINLREATQGTCSVDYVQMDAEEYVESLNLPEEEAPDANSLVEKIRIGEEDAYYFVTPYEKEGYTNICAYFDLPLYKDVIIIRAIIREGEGGVEHAIDALSRLFAV